jgi:hypothetical protein
MKKIPKKVRETIINDLMIFLRGKQDKERKAIAYAYFEKKEYEKNKKLH